jgi:MarR family transcriptional regulator, transcriptional regulator for hemolysin
MDNSDDQTIGFLISDAARMMRTVFDRRVRKLGLTRAQWLVLARLHRRPGASQSELAEMMEVEKASAGRMVDRLERKGWVVRRADPEDRRINRLYLTSDAEKISKRLWAIAEQTVNDAVCDLNTSQTKQLSALLTTVKARLVTMAALNEPSLRAGGLLRNRITAQSRSLETRDEADADGVIAGGNAR